MTCGEGTYTTLKELKLTNALNSFSKKKCDDVFCKKYRIIRKNNKDIVHPKEKSLD